MLLSVSSYELQLSFSERSVFRHKIPRPKVHLSSLLFDFSNFIGGARNIGFFQLVPK